MSLTDTLRYAAMDERQRGNVQSIIDEHLRLGDAVGSWSMKCQARQTGASHYLTFENKVDVFDALQFVERMDQSPPMLVDACEKLLRADARVTELYDALQELVDELGTFEHFGAVEARAFERAREVLEGTDLAEQGGQPT